MRLVHTSDWHLGHTLHDAPRDHEHRAFIAWLLERLVEQRADVLLVTGDVFDSANPPAVALTAWYDFLAEARRRCPDLDIVVIGGNHDSPARLDAPERLLRSLRMHIIGGLPRTATGELDLDRLIVPVRDAGGRVAGWVAAVPFLRAADLPRDAEGPSGDPLVEGVRAIYAEVLTAARARCQPDQALIATGHCFMVSTRVSHLSERRILGGNQHALPLNIFPRDLSYVALGHLHKPQRVGRAGNVRYAGAPLALAMNEAAYKHQILVVDFDGAELAALRPIYVPRLVELLRVPPRGALPVADLASHLALLQPAIEGEPPWSRPFLEVCVALDRPEPRLRALVEEALADRRPRLVRLDVEYTGSGAALTESMSGRDLKDLDPEDVFVRRYQRDHDGDPPPPLVTAFRELLDHVRAGGDS